MSLKRDLSKIPISNRPQFKNHLLFYVREQRIISVFDEEDYPCPYYHTEAHPGNDNTLTTKKTI